MNEFDTLRARYSEIQTEINRAAKAAGRPPGSVTLIAVSKFHAFEKIRELYRAGQRDFGENYVQELLEKAEMARKEGLAEIRWHFIGHLQTNKVKLLLPHVAMIHGVGALRLVEEIGKRAENRKIPILIEVNVDSQESKSGVQISELRNLIEASKRISNLELQGLMCIPDPERPAGAREAFHRLAALGRDYGLPVLSMGMTSDFPDAIAEGATHIRVGTAIFGERLRTER